MIRTQLSTTSVIDDAGEVVSRAGASWAALLAATLIPYRFLQALFFDQLLEVGSDASRYGNLLGGTANMIVASVLLAFFGRAVYARAVRLALGRDSAPGREAWRVSPAAFLSYLLTASAAMFVGYLSLFTIFGFIAAVMLSGLAVGTMELNERPGVVGPFRHIMRYTQRVGVPLALVFVFFCAFMVAFVNLGAAFALGQWLISSIGGFDAPHWNLLYGLGNRRFTLMLIAGALIIVEPFWIAAHVVYVSKAGAAERGDDLRIRFEELKRAS